MEENNRKGPGVFYAVVGVATLVVAIIGATFAYFSVAVEGNNNNTTITGTTGTGISLKLQVNKVTTEATGNLVPLDTMEPWYTLNTAQKSQLNSALKNTTSCVDNAGSTVCQVYSITISGTEFAGTTLNALGSLTLESGATNMKWKVLTDATTDNEANAAVAKGTAGYINGPNGVALSNSKKTETYYVAVWLEETNSDQSATATDETNKDFTGTVTFSAVDASGKTTNLTATFATSGTTTD